MDVFTTAPIAGDEISASEAAVYTLVNNYRVANGRSSVQHDASLSAVANRHALDLLNNVGRLTHDWSIGSNDTGQAVFQMAAAENTGGGTFSPISSTSIFNAWVNSAGHNANILNPLWRSVGHGYASNGDVAYWVQLFSGIPDPTVALDIDYNTHLWRIRLDASTPDFTGNTRHEAIGGTAGANVILGLDGNDSIGGGGGADYLSGNRGNDTISSSGSDATIVGGQGDDNIFGGGNVNGNLGADLIFAGDFNDSLRGGRDNDTIAGRGGNDTIAGDLGNDVLSGGAGADLFRIADGTGDDRLTDWTPADGDRIIAPGPIAASLGSEGVIITYADATITLLGRTEWDNAWLVIA